MQRMPARIFCALLITDSGSLTATELAELLQVSPAAVSGSVRYLISMGMINREGEPGSRRHHYRVPELVWDQIMLAETRLRTRWMSVLREGAELVGPASPAGKRLAESADYMEFLSVELGNMIKRWHEFEAARQHETGGRPGAEPEPDASA